MPSEAPPVPHEIDVRRAWMRKAVRWACRRHQHTVDRRGMNPRRASEKLDDIAMGEIASISVMQFLTDRGRSAVAYDEVRTDGYADPDPGWDVAVSREEDLHDWAGGPPQRPASPPGTAHRLSVKSSRIPAADADDVRAAVARRDFKVLKATGRLEDDLTADFEVQVYYELAQSALPGALAATLRDIAGGHAAAIIHDLQMATRYGRCYLVGFCPSDRIIAHHETLVAAGKRRTWSSRHAGYEKTMWRAPLRLGTSPGDLPDV